MKGHITVLQKYAQVFFLIYTVIQALKGFAFQQYVRISKD